MGHSSDGTAEEAERYRQMLVRTLHSATIKFPDVAANIVPVLVEFLSEDSENAAQDVLVFLREALQKLPHLRNVVLAQLLVCSIPTESGLFVVHILSLNNYL